MNKKTSKYYLMIIIFLGLVWGAVQPAAGQDLNPGIKAFTDGNYDQAIQLINQYIQQKPTDEQGYYYLGSCYYAQGKYDQAIEQFNKALNIKPKYWEAQNQLGLTYLKKGMLDEAEKVFKEGLKSKARGADLSFRKAIATDEKNAEYHRNLGNVNFKKDVLVIAIQEYKNALELDSSLVEAHFNLAEAYLKQMRFNEAMDEYKTVIRLDPTNKDAYHALGGIYMLDGKHYPEARIIYEEYLKFDPQDTKALTNLGISYYFLSKILAYLVVNGDSLTRSDMLDRAIQNLEKSASLKPGVAETYFYLGKSYLDKGESQGALQAFGNYESIMNQNHYEWKKEDADFWVNKGQAFAALGDSISQQEAIAAFDTAIQLDSSKITAYSSLGATLFDQGKYAEAIPFFQKKIEADTTNASSYLNLAFSYLKLERYKEAVDPLKKVVELKPDNANALDLLARVYLNLNRFSDAKDAYIKEIQLNGSNCDLQSNVGYCYMRLENPAGAVPYFQKAVSCYPNKIDNLLNLAKALELTKNLDEAYKYYVKVLEIDPKNKEAIDGRDRIDMQKF
jgi:tetratricopeptide (TPR) repeat protein